MFHISALCDRDVAHAVARVSDARFAVHFFAANASVNSLLYCWALNSERPRLWKSLCARRNVSPTIAHHACANTREDLNQFRENVLLPPDGMRARTQARYGVAVVHTGLPAGGMLSFAHRG
jgi:hypothetical protein